MKLLQLTIRFNKQQFKSGKIGINFSFILNWKQKYIAFGLTLFGLDIDLEINK